jgi:hypothetical protein
MIAALMWLKIMHLVETRKFWAWGRSVQNWYSEKVCNDFRIRDEVREWQQQQ